MEGRLLGAPSGIVLAEGPMHSVEQSKGFHRAIREKTPARMEGFETPNIHFGQVHGGFALDDPLGQGHAHAAPGLDADGIEARGHE